MKKETETKKKKERERETLVSLVGFVTTSAVCLSLVH